MKDATQPRSPAGGQQLPVLPPWQALAELAVLTGLILGLDWVLPGVELSDMQPNPFWFPILLLSLQYGTVSGVLAAGLAVVVTMLSGLPEQGVGENHFAYLVRVWAQPILWIAAAVFFGQFRMRQIAAKQELQRSVEELSGQRSALAEYATNLRSRCDQLERELAGHPAAPAHALLDALAAVQGSGAAEPAFARLIDVLLPRAAVSLFVVEDGTLRRLVSAGWPAGDRWRTELTHPDPLYAAIVENGLPVLVIEKGDEAKLGEEGLAAVPIVSSDGARSLGMLKVEQAEPQLVDAALLPRLRVIAAALAPLVERRAPSAGHVLRDSGTGKVAAEAEPPRARRQFRWLPGGRAGEAAGAAAKKTTVG